MGDYKPTDQAYGFLKDVSAEIDSQLSALKIILKDDISMFNKLVREKSIDAVILSDE